MIEEENKKFGAGLGGLEYGFYFENKEGQPVAA